MNILNEYEELLDYCATVNNTQFNKEKALEEAVEFLSDVIKNSTKAEFNPNRPDRDMILKEYGDFQYRGMIFLMELFPELKLEQIQDLIDDHLHEKFACLTGWREAGTYSNGL